MIDPPHEKDPIYILMAGLMVWIIVVMVLIIVVFVSSSGVGLEGGLSTSEDTPLILSENNANHILRLWAPPSSSTVVLYDQWDVWIFGSVNDTYEVKINDVETFNGSLTQEHINLSYDASRLSYAHVSISIGNKTYQWVNIAINHQEIGYNGPGSGGASLFKFTQSDINRSNLKTAFIVTVYAVISIFVAFWGVKLYRKRQITTRA